GRLCRNALMLLAPLGILRSESRTALVVMILLCPGLFYLLRRHRRELWVGAGVGLVAAPFFINLETAFYRFSQLVGNLRGSATVMDTSLEERSELLRQGLQLLRDNWILGSGPGTFPSATGFVSHEWTLRPAHNTYLELASEQGIPGMAAGGIFILVLLWSLYQGWRDSRDPVAANRVLGVGMGLAAFGLMAATLNLLTFAMGYLTLGCALALLHQARWGRDGERAA
ncbi:MAG TPA: O-antigen ligase family protein, partial [Myxococcota bacterium]|nr:O-antigen ligase family protein [Myxococcota bacterium]